MDQDGETVVPPSALKTALTSGSTKQARVIPDLRLSSRTIHGASKVVKSILDTANESLQVLSPDDFLIGVARVAQHGLEHVGTAVTTRRCESGHLYRSRSAGPDRVEFPPEQRDSRLSAFDRIS